MKLWYVASDLFTGLFLLKLIMKPFPVVAVPVYPIDNKICLKIKTKIKI
jgi:hypothetical protein